MQRTERRRGGLDLSLLYKVFGAILFIYLFLGFTGFLRLALLLVAIACTVLCMFRKEERLFLSGWHHFWHLNWICSEVNTLHQAMEYQLKRQQRI